MQFDELTLALSLVLRFSVRVIHWVVVFETIDW